MTSFLSLRCPDCGKKITEEDHLCPHCGVNLDAPLGGDQLHLLAQEYFARAKRAYERGSNSKEALEEITASIQCRPNSAEAHNLHGLILDDLGRRAEAIRAYEEALQLDPSLSDARANFEDAREEEQDEADPQEEVVLKSQPMSWCPIAVRVLLIITGVVLGYLQQRGDLGPQVAFEPDHSLISNVEAGALEETADILNDRSEELGYSRVSFHVTEDGRITGRLPVSVDVADFAGEIGVIGLLEFVDFGYSAMVDGSVIRTDLTHPYIKQADGKIYHTILTNNAIRNAHVGKSNIEGTYLVNFTLTPDAAKVFAEYTGSNVGRYLGIVVDKVIISAPRVGSAITDGQVTISGGFTLESAKHLAAILNTKPLPMPLRLVDEQ